MKKDITNNERIAKNTFLLFVRMFFVLIVSLYTSRVILNILGVTDFGIYNVVAGLVSLFGFFNSTLSSSMQRFYNFELGKNGDDGVSSIYSVGLLIHVAFSIIVFVLLETIGLWYINHVLVAPVERLFAINILYQTIVVSTILVIMQIPYIGAVVAYEKMDFFSIASILDVVLKLGIALVLPYLGNDKLIVYSLLLLGVSVFDFVLYFFYTKQKIPSVKYTSNYNLTLFKRILSFSGWNLLGTFAFVLKGQGLNLLLNYFCGPIINAARGIAFQVNGAVNGFSNNIATAFRPQLVNSYAEGNVERSTSLMIIESKASFFLIAVILAPLCFEIDLVLHLWLGSVIPEETMSFTLLTLIDLLICTLNTPCTQIIFATGKIKMYQIGSTVVNLSLLPASWIALKLGYNANMVFILTIIFSVVNQIVCFIFTNLEVRIGALRYVKSVCIPCLFFLIFFPIPLLGIYLFMEDSFIRLVLMAVVSLVSGLIVSLLFLWDGKEKDYILHFLKLDRLCQK